MNHEHFMREAIKEAEKGRASGNWPIGSVITIDDKIVARDYSRIYSSNNRLAHAEKNVLEQAQRFLFDKKADATLYTTYSPCVMCFGAIIMSRINTLVYGTDIDNTGFAPHRDSLPSGYDRDDFDLEVIGGVLEKECREIFIKNRFGVK